MGRASKARKRARQREKRLKHGMPLTKRTPRNQKYTDGRQGYAKRKQNYEFYYKCKCRGE